MLTSDELKAATNYESAEYAKLCDELGMLPECRFVRVTKAGTISGTVGKPREWANLYSSVRCAGYKPSADLKRTARAVIDHSF